MSDDHLTGMAAIVHRRSMWRGRAANDIGDVLMTTWRITREHDM